ncbi:DUF3048 domain-containing protein [Candidatus Saccharibacteria bacterium]|nr:DUF3048 domain-containing protein [Candidatus Saccharibacteria bacterium]
MEAENQEPLAIQNQLNKTPKSWLVFLIIGIVGVLGGVACLLVALLAPKEILPDLEFPTIPSTTSVTKIYSNLTGLEIASEADKTAPAYCIQTPNGTDGARPQVGLTEAGVVFEAIAEVGITRFAAIYQKPTSAVIGPIRSLRIYYLQWDTPFDCAIVHAGGSDDAIAAVRSGGYKDLTENYTYMYRGGYGRLWNNLFTTSQYLAQVSEDWEFGGSNIKGFNRMTPEESKKSRIDDNATNRLVITKPTTESTSAMSFAATDINIYFGGSPTFNVNYQYNQQSNSYDRWYENGDAHEVYQCPAEDLGEPTPEDVCSLTQLSPAVVAVMLVEEWKAEDGYHEDIAAIGSGEAYVFQNGNVIHGTWNKSTWEDQIKFFDEAGAEIKLAPGQTFVEAVPDYGGVEY